MSQHYIWNGLLIQFMCIEEGCIFTDLSREKVEEHWQRSHKGKKLHDKSYANEPEEKLETKDGNVESKSRALSRSPSTMHCEYCDTVIPGNYMYCDHCGKMNRFSQSI